MGFISRLFGKKPTEDEILNEGVGFAMNYGPTGRRPIQQRLFSRYKYLSKEQLDRYNSICKVVLDEGSNFVFSTLDKVSVKKETISGDELRKGFDAYMLTKYPWMSAKNLGLLYGAGFYLVHKERLDGCIK